MRWRDKEKCKGSLNTEHRPQGLTTASGIMTGSLHKEHTLTIGAHNSSLNYGFGICCRFKELSLVPQIARLYYNSVFCMQV
jgi:hypothetical protein